MDSTFDHDKAWCYPYTYFEIVDITADSRLSTSSDYVSSYSNTFDDLDSLLPISFEEYNSQDEWTEDKYAASVVFESETSQTVYL